MTSPPQKAPAPPRPPSPGSAGPSSARIPRPSSAREQPAKPSSPESPTDSAEEEAKDEGVSKPRKGLVIRERYRVQSLIARGGMGSVWSGMDLELDRGVAIKFMDPKIAKNDSLRDRFRREAKAAAQLRTPHVVEIYDYGIDGKLMFIVMELLDGEDLQTRLRRKKRLDLDETARILEQCSKALTQAQKAGIVHRDMKPGNIFIARHDGDDEIVKILDFGVAKMPRSQAPVETTRDGLVFGSPQYMSPEQARSHAVDHRSDLWSLAAIAFRTLTGKLAFTGTTEADVVVKVCAGAIPLPSQIIAGIGSPIDTFFQHAFQREPDARFQSAAELSEAFSAAVKATAEVQRLSPDGEHRPPIPSAGARASWVGISHDELSFPQSAHEKRQRMLLIGGSALLLVAIVVVGMAFAGSESEPSEPASTAAPINLQPKRPATSASVAAPRPADADAPAEQTARAEQATPAADTASAEPAASTTASAEASAHPKPAPRPFPRGKRPNWGY